MKCKTCGHEKTSHNQGTGCHHSFLSVEEVVKNYETLPFDEFMGVRDICECELFEETREARDGFYSLFKGDIV